MGYLHEWRKTLDQGEFIPVMVATEFVEFMRREAPEELQDWLSDHAVRFVSDELSSILRRERQTVIRRAAARSFALAAASGDRDRLGAFTMVYTIDDSNTRRTVKNMTGRDHLYVADAYTINGNRVLLLAEFHRAIARRVGDRRTEDVMSEQEYERLLGSIVGRVPLANEEAA